MRNTGQPRKKTQQDDSPRQWRDDDSVINSYIFNPDNGDYSVNPDLYGTLYDDSPIGFYHLIVDQNIINNIVIETNKYAAQQIASKVISPHSRLNKWYDTNESEMKCFEQFNKKNPWQCGYEEVRSSMGSHGSQPVKCIFF